MFKDIRIKLLMLSTLTIGLRFGVIYLLLFTASGVLSAMIGSGFTARVTD
jgi:hypothetical protein